MNCCELGVGGGCSAWHTGTGDHQINNLDFCKENSIIVFAHLSVTKQANTLAATELIIVHYVCLEDFGQTQKD